MQDYRKLKIWIKAHELAIHVYKITSAFPGTEVYGITKQIRRSAVSIAANIAEGCGKKSSKDFQNFLSISLGSANETSYYILLAKDLSFISSETFQFLNKEISEIISMLISLMSVIKN